MKNKEKILSILNEILEHELAGVVRYGHYSFMVFGHNRIPIVKWFREQATESMNHAYQVGEWITALDGHPSLKIGKLLETQKHSIKDILNETLAHEEAQLEKFEKLLSLLGPSDIALEEFARGMMLDETLHVQEVRKMIRTA